MVILGNYVCLEKRSIYYILLPSALKLGSREYYEKPWEITADYFGGVIPDTDYTLKEAYLKDGFDYLLYA
jgi:hypothetical protein